MSIALHHINDDNRKLFQLTIRETHAICFPSAVSPFPGHTSGTAASGRVLIFTAPLSDIKIINDVDIYIISVYAVFVNSFCKEVDFLHFYLSINFCLKAEPSRRSPLNSENISDFVYQVPSRGRARI